MLMLLKPLLPEILLFLGACSILLLDVFQKLTNHLISLAVGIITICLGCLTLYSTEGIFFHQMFITSSFTYLIKVSLLLLGLFYFVSVPRLIPKQMMNRNEHSVMIFFMMLGASIMVSSNHLVLLYVGMEIQALSAYTLAVMQRKSKPAAEGGVKYFILGSLASVVFLFGASYVYGAYGTLFLGDIVTAGDVSMYVGILGVVLILCAMSFKVGAFPFHQWVPDVYQGAPLPSTAILSTLGKVAAVAVLLKLVICFFEQPLPEGWSINTILSGIAVGSMFIGALIPILQTHIKRLLGYSAIGHTGFIMLGIIDINADGIAAALTYTILYSLTLIMTWVCIISLRSKQLGSDEDSNDIPLNQLEGLAQNSPKHAFVLSICFLSMAGIPPLIGFFPKLLLIQYVLGKSHFVVAAFAIFTTIISLFYYLKLVKMMYIDMPVKQMSRPTSVMNVRLMIVFVPVVLIQLIGCYVPLLQTIYQEYIIKSAHSLCVGVNEADHL